MGKKNLQLDEGLADPVQAALLKAAARQMRCSKEKPEEKAEGDDAGTKADDTAVNEASTALAELGNDRPTKRLRRAMEADFQSMDTQETLVLGEDVPGTPAYEVGKDDKPEKAKKEKKSKKEKKATTTNDADKAETAKNADKAERAKNADKAETAKNAGKAKREKNADEAETGKNADKPKRAKTADEAERAKNADKAERPKNADKAETAKNAGKAKREKNADEAETAKNADKAKRAKNADEAETAKNASEAERAKNADEAETAKNADKAKREKNADKAKRAKKPEKAEIANNADKAERAKNAGKAETAKNADEAERGKNADQAETQANMAQARAELAISEDEGGDESDFCPRELNFDGMEVESNATADLEAVGAKLWESDDACDEDTLRDDEQRSTKEKEQPKPESKMEVQKVNDAKVQEQLAKEMREQEAKDKDGLAKEARLKEHLAKELEKEKRKATKVKKETEKEIKGNEEPSVNQSKSGEEEKKRPIATPQAAAQHPKPEPGIVRKSSSMTAVAEVLNRSNTEDLSPPTPPPCSVTRSHGAPENAQGDTEKANGNTEKPKSETENAKDDESSDEETPNPHKDLEDIPTETRLAMVSKGPRKRTKEQLAVHRKKQSFYRTLVSSRSPPEIRSMAANARASTNKNEMLQVLYEQWVQSGGKWETSQLVIQARSTIKGDGCSELTS
eukprot:s332_g5.t1